MTTPQTNKPSVTTERLQPLNSQSNQQQMNHERIKQMIMDTLIELDIVPQPQKKKALENV